MQRDMWPVKSFVSLNLDRVQGEKNNLEQWSQWRTSRTKRARTCFDRASLRHADCHQVPIKFVSTVQTLLCRTTRSIICYLTVVRLKRQKKNKKRLERVCAVPALQVRNTRLLSLSVWMEEWLMKSSRAQWQRRLRGSGGRSKGKRR